MLLSFTKKDFTIDWFSGSGGGGQHRNKHQNCCRITHIDTGLRAQATEFKERHRNQKLAFERLAKRLISHLQLHREPERRSMLEEVRKYHAVDNYVLDHASGHRDTYSDVAVKGRVHDMILARKQHAG